MARTTGKNGLPLPRSLANARAVRRELIAVYRGTKGGEIEPQMAGRLVHTLNVIAGLDNGRLFDERLAEVERLLSARQAPANGHDAEMRP